MVHKGRTAKLIMPASLMEDAGKYSVRAVNQLGEVSTSGFITVKGRFRGCGDGAKKAVRILVKEKLCVLVCENDQLEDMYLVTGTRVCDW